jgi:putative ABC transport system permease protein
MVGVGVLLGLSGAALVVRSLRSMLYGLSPFDPTTFIVVSVIFAAVAMLATFVPARRATRVDPLVALRCE